MNVAQNITEAIGNTPLARLNKIEEFYELDSQIYSKLEFMNPSGTIKARTALYMIRDAEKTGRLFPGGTIIEPTSGNTGIGLCAIGCSLGYKTIIVMPDSMSKERIDLMKAYGATVVLTPAKDGMAGSIEKAEQIQSETQNSIIAGQFDNPSNIQAHYETTGPEIYSQMSGKIDIFVSGIGTSGTLCGTAKYLKEKDPDIMIVGIEPERSPLLTKGEAGSHGLQGIGANFVPTIYDNSYVDEIITISDEAAFEMTKRLVRLEGYFTGITAGANIAGAVELAKRYPGKNIVTVFPDGGEKYMSTGIFE